MKYTRFIVFCSFLLTMLGCGIPKNQHGQVNEIPGDLCLQPLFNSTFPVGDDAFEVLATLKPMYPILAPNTWQNISKFPESEGTLTNIFLFSYQSEFEQIWVTVKGQNDTKIWTYDVNGKVWSVGPIISEEAKLFTDSKGNIWVVEPLYLKSSSLYKVSTSVMTLEPQAEKNGLFANHNILNAAPSPDGMIWLILGNPGFSHQLYLYNPLSSELSEHLDPQHYIGLEVDNEGVVYAVLQDGTIYRYNPEKRESTEYFISLDNGTLNSNGVTLLISESGFLWVSDIARFRLTEDTLDQQQSIIRSPVFITQYFSGYQPFTWERPEPQADTADGRIWYRSTRGLTWHQPETGEWCMFTTAQSNIVKDSEDNLWIIYDNSLYMLPASETKARDD